MTARARAAEEALRLAEADPDRAVGLAAAVAREARRAGDVDAGAVAERAWGLAALHREDLDTALRHLRHAVVLGRDARSPRLAAEARMTLAFALNQRGRPRQALAEIDQAIQDLGRVQRARARAQRGAILHQLGRLDEALDSYRAALPALRRAGDRLWIHRVVLNRGVLNAQRHAFGAAQADLLEAERLCVELGLEMSLGYAQANLGYVHGLQGDVPTALEYFDKAERRIRATHAQLGPLLTDRGELLLSALLVSEALASVEAAVTEFERERRRLAVPEVRLLLARAATLDHDLARALAQARLASREFAGQHRPQWAALADLAVVQCDLAAGRRVTLPRVLRIVDAVAAGGWPAATLEARLVAAKVALERGRTEQARAQLELAGGARGYGPVTLRSRRWYATALGRLASDDTRGAVRALRAGLRVLDQYGAVLGATDLRAHAAGQRADLTSLGLRLAFQDARPRAVLEWAEQGRASHLRQRPVRPPQDTALAADLALLRGTVVELDRTGAGRARAALVRTQVTLERRIRDRVRLAHGRHQPQPIGGISVAELGAALGGAALIEFVQHGDDMHVVTVVDGRVRLRRLGPVAQIRDLVDRIPFALHRLGSPHSTQASQSAALVLLRHAAGRLDSLLLEPLPETRERPLVVVPTGPLQSMAWSVLPSCTGRAVSVAPSAALWQAAGRRTREERGRVAVAAGPALPGARAEAEAVAAIHHTSAITGASATVEAVTAALNRADLAHLAAHGSTNPHNPLFSSLRFADGPLMIYDLERLDRVPHTVVLAACDTGRPVVYAGDELLGLSATFLSLGATQLIAPVLPVLDSATAPLMVAFHRLLARGEPPAVALALAQRDMAGDPTAAAAGFVCLGYGFSS